MMIVALQFYEADKAKAMRLARMIADIENPSWRGGTPIMLFCARYDCAQDTETMRYVQERGIMAFPFTTITKTQGWPDGPNGVACDVLKEIARTWADTPAVLLLEPDCVPLAPDWLDKLADESACANWEQKFVVGAYRNSGPPGGHINGVMVLRGKFVAQLRFDVPMNGYAWDCALAPQILPVAHRTGLIKNCFQSENATEEQLRTPDIGSAAPVLVHGFKDDSAYLIARKWLNL